MAKRKLFHKKETSSEPSKWVLFLKSDVTHFVTGLIVLMFTVYAIISIISFLFTGAADQSKIEGHSFFFWGQVSGVQNWTGTRGAILSNILMNDLFGISTIFLLVFLAFVGLRLMKAKYVNLIKYFVLYAVLTIWTSLALSFFFGKFFKDTYFYIGGKHGFLLSDLMINNFGVPGALLIILVLLVIIMACISSRTIPFIRNLFKLKPKEKKEKKEKEKKITVKQEDTKEEYPKIEEPEIEEPKIDNKKPVVDDSDFEIVVPNGNEDQAEPPVSDPEPVKYEADETPDDDGDENTFENQGPYDPKADLSTYKLPTVDLLQKYNHGDTQVDMVEQTANKNRIIETLNNYGIKIKSIKATVGPTVTLYEIIPEAGVRISKIKNLENDIAMSLAALGIRIIAPMPGKGTIGIEVPNKDPQIVSMHSIISSRKFQESNFELPIALGRTITNEVFMVDLIKMPHLLVAGATGQGKSVGLNAAITSLLYRKHPAELKFVLIDPKMVEFSLYSVIEKHFLAKLPDTEKPIITDFTKVIYTLNSLTKEMDDRYELLEKARSRNVQEYNEKFINRHLNPMKGHRYMPYIVVIIDEFGDLIMTAGKEIEQPIARIAQKARAVGIHMIIATQRPTTNIITGTIKANFPARVAFRVITAIDSRTILDNTGANQLIGRGDMLFFQGNDMTRIQCAFVDTPEVERITKFIGNERGYATAYMLPEYTGEQSGENSSTASLSDLDPMFEEVARAVVIHQQGSTSWIQRRYSIGYNRAGRITDQLEQAGIVSSSQSGKPREVLIQDEYHLEQILNSLK